MKIVLEYVMVQIGKMNAEIVVTHHQVFLKVIVIALDIMKIVSVFVVEMVEIGMNVMFVKDLVSDTI